MRSISVTSFNVAPDKLTLSVDAQTVLAGGSAQASTKASRKGIEFPYLNSNLIKYDIYDAENKYPLGSDKITIDVRQVRLTLTQWGRRCKVYM